MRIQSSAPSRSHLPVLVIAATVSVFNLSGEARGQTNEDFKLLPADGAAGDHFGYSVAIDGATAIVGAYSDSDNGSGSGSAYLFDACTGQELAKLLPADGATLDWFGFSVAISGNTAIVGAWRDDDNGSESGSAYLFDVTTGQELAKLVPAGGVLGDEFGFSVAISGNTAVIGADRDDDNGTNAGAAYVFDVTTGQELAKLLPADGSTYNFFGWSVAVSGSTAIVGAPIDDDNGIESGSAYLFDVTTGQELAKLLPAGGVLGDQFGISVAISGTTAIVGNYKDDSLGVNAGSAHLFDVTTGQELAKLLPADGAEGDWFGWWVAISGSTAIVGSQGDDDNGSASGSAYLFDVATGQQLAKLLPSDGATGDIFASVAISGTTAVVGASWDDDSGTSSGSAYLFDATGCIGTNYCVAVANSSGLPASIVAHGSEVIADNDVTLITTDVAANRFGYYLMSTTQAFVPLFGGGMGNLCLGGQIIRFNVPPYGEVGFSGTEGVITFEPDLTNLPQHIVFQPGETWNFQLWFRDVVGGSSTHNTSDGLSITWQ